MNELGNRRRYHIPLSPADLEEVKGMLEREARRMLTPGTKFTIYVGPWEDGSTQVAWFYSERGSDMPYGPDDPKRQQTTATWHTA
jgi:hypothetical protein